VVVRTCKTSLL